MTLCHKRTDLQAQAFEYLYPRVILTPEERGDAADQALLHYWKDVKKDLNKLIKSGFESQSQEAKLVKKLETLSQKAQQEVISLKIRMRLIGEMFQFLDCLALIKEITQVMMAAAHSDDERMTLATCFEQSPYNGYLKQFAREIYREVGDDEAYLASRLPNMNAAEDYYDLALFYRDKDNLKKAVEIAEQGLAIRYGSKQELRIFLAEYALNHEADRQRYLQLLYENMQERFSLQSYITFEAYCSPSEWLEYEPGILKRLESQSVYTRLPIYLHRQEKEIALALLLDHSGGTVFPEGKLLEYAQSLEADFPKEIRSLYQGIVQNDRFNTGRPAYTKQAKLTVRIREIYLNHLKEPAKWDQFRRELKHRHLAKSAYQAVFTDWVYDWTKL
ncbi:hypothetical protein [Vampirovibrio sp.]|uniref:hypothetical protein n=1 Tax=Vampirovibrio sp. TaxID=2717857 RepID=UPI003593013B